MRLLATVIVSIAALASSGCTGMSDENANAGANANRAATQPANANANTGATETAPLTAREPQSYSADMTLTGEAAANNRQQPIPTIQFNFARMGADRRWAFNSLLPIGEVVYIEKSGLKYLVFPSQSRYVELKPDELGIPLGSLLTPTMAIEQLKSRVPYQNLGTETVDGRTAIKYRFAATAETHTEAGSAQTDSIIYVDEATGLPLRAEIYVAASGGQTARIMTETRNIHLNPELAMFDVPAGMRKVTAQELKQQIRVFIMILRGALQVLSQQMGVPPSGTAPPQQ